MTGRDAAVCGVNTKFGAAGSERGVDMMIAPRGSIEVQSSKALAHFGLAASFLWFFEIGIVTVGGEENKKHAQAVPACL